jgi:hypothetical protein
MNHNKTLPEIFVDKINQNKTLPEIFVDKINHNKMLPEIFVDGDPSIVLGGSAKNDSDR